MSMHVEVISWNVYVMTHDWLSSVTLAYVAALWDRIVDTYELRSTLLIL